MSDRASPDEPLPPRTEDEGATLDQPAGLQGFVPGQVPGGFVPGQVLGERYRVLDRLGRGGMGEVWHAFDLKLRVELALKALREDFFKSGHRLELLRQEVRAAREVVSPNVCRIFDLIELEGRELVSMEYVDGATLLAVLQERGPLELKEAQDIASQFLAGLEAIHGAGLVHRDIKPENIMLTRSGRVVVMDFGLARQEAEAGGTVSGTPAYMAPEQAAGQVLDARADVYSAGVVLAEMVSPEGIRRFESRQSLWEGVRSEPAKLPDTPWAAVIKRAVARDREVRFRSAHTLTRALKDVTLRVAGAEDLHPYPGLASFTEDDAEYFFGREAEVEQMWRKLEGPARMLALVGPSGAGKTSFLRAGLIPVAREGWAAVVCTPGSDPRAALRRAVISQLEGDSEALRELAEGSDTASVSAVARWRHRHGHAAVIVDQFEELFTQNTVDEQHRFATILGRLILEANVFVVLSMRDDFLIHCNRHESLRPLFSELTPLDPPTGGSLRRALTQPALQCGYRFEDDELVEEMLAEVEGERGALPLLAFAAARLWEKRDRETGLLTRTAFHDIGGVGGALARHAEATVDRIGHEHLPTVRELFRNLVTAEGTRAVREWDELLSVFADSRRESAAEVVRQLIDARLLTSYEVREADEAPTRRVEIIHESLLANWPRLVRWQTQDADAAQLRDQLRQAARTWDEHGRTDDMLWTGSAFREYAVWRERYSGGLSELEEAFAAAMTSLATRRRRRRRIAAVAAVVLALTVAAVFGTLWRRSVQETRRAEAQKLLAIAQVQLDTDPTEALAYTTASLELADTHEARVFAVRTLWAGPPVRVLGVSQVSGAEFLRNTFSPDGRWLVASPIVSENVLVYEQGGGQPIILGGHAVSASGPIGCAWTRDNLLVTGHHTESRVRVWSMPGGDLVATIELGEPAWWQVGQQHLLAEVGPQSPPPAGEPWQLDLVRWRLPDGSAEPLGTVDVRAVDFTVSGFDPRGGAWIYSRDDGVYARRLPVVAGASDTLLGRHSSDEVVLGDWCRSDGFYSCDRGGEIILWSASDGAPISGRRLPTPETEAAGLIPDPSGRWTFEKHDPAGQLHLWDSAGMRGAAPWVLRRGGMAWTLSHVDFHPHGNWVVATTRNHSEVSFWPLASPRAVVVEGWWGEVEFTPDARHLVTTDCVFGGVEATMVRLWPLPGSGSADLVELRFPQTPRVQRGLAVDLQGRQVLSAGYGHDLFVLPVSGAPPRRFEGFSADDVVDAVGFSPSGRLAAAASMISVGPAQLRVWDLETGEVKVFDQPEDPEAHEGYYAFNLSFVDESTLYTAGANGLLRWDIEAGTHVNLLRAPPGGFIIIRVTSDRRRMLVWEPKADRTVGPTALHDLATGEVRALEIPPPGQGLDAFTLSPDGTLWASGEPDGRVWVGRTDGGEPHLLPGHDSSVVSLAISPDLEWIASAGEDGTLRLFPMPDLTKPPLHTLPHDELIAKLRSLTNLRVVRDESSSTGWKVEVGRFPGWATIPEWNP